MISPIYDKGYPCFLPIMLFASTKYWLELCVPYHFACPFGLLAAIELCKSIFISYVPSLLQIWKDSKHSKSQCQNPLCITFSTLMSFPFLGLPGFWNSRLLWGYDGTHMPNPQPEGQGISLCLPTYSKHSCSYQQLQCCHHGCRVYSCMQAPSPG